MDRYRVVLSGHTLAGVDLAAARAQLARLMNRDETFAGQLLAGKATVAKANIDAAKGERYKAALAAIGVDCRIELELLEFDVAVRPVQAPISESGAPPGPSPASERAVPSAKPAADYGLFLLALPVAACIAAWFWITNLTLLQSPGSKLDALMVITILGTALLAAVEASKLGMTTNRAKGTYSPVQ